MKGLDPIKIPLTGTHIIEASAGTGKTYAISNILLRLILEEGLPVENILIVSFTEAATNELRHRIRQRLQEALNALAGRPGDRFLERLLSKQREEDSWIWLLKRAIRDLDNLTISTIHGFCRRVIIDNAFESGTLLDTRLIVSQEPIKQEIIYDFWRNHIYHESPMFIDYMTKNSFDPEGVGLLIDTYLIRPYVKVIPEIVPEDTASYEREYKDLLDQIYREWSCSRSEIRDILMNSKALNRRIYSKNKVIRWLDYMDRFINARGYEFAVGEIIKRFSKDYLHSSTKKGYTSPEHPLFGLMERLCLLHERLEALYRKKLVFIKRQLIAYVEHELKKRKLFKNLVSFDDLVWMVYRGVSEQGLLTDTLRNRFLVGMIDEFQDTDPVQYEIFKRIFDAQGHALYLIGDPKQSIYSFRGADIFTYIKASRDIGSRFTLKENWRSHPSLIEAINRIFSMNENPFFYKEIRFIPAEPARDSNVETLSLDNLPEPCMKIWLFDHEEYGTKFEIKERIARAVAEEISRLLYLGKEKRLMLGDNMVKASDIAVLVKRNMEARLIQQELSAFHIPTVVYSTSNIFGSWEYMEIQNILYGIYYYSSEPCLKAALGTDMMGLMGEDMEALDEAEWEGYMQKFKRYHELWNRFGFISMFREFLNKESIMPRLMRFEDGERRCTNVLHLMEVIHEAEREYMLGMEGLIKWLSAQKDEQVSGLEEYQLRLESDESAVKVITVHRSKGLEFPIIFLPFAWEGAYRRSLSNAPVIFHDPKNRHDYILDIGSEQQKDNMQLEREESLAEDIRLLYVALTRAKNCCYLVLGEEKKSSQGSGLSYLFSDKTGTKIEEFLRNKKEIFRGMEKDVFVTPIPDIGKGYEHLEYKGEELLLRRFSGHVDGSWHITSFSSLVSSRAYVEEVQDMDATAQEEADEEEEGLKEASLNIFSFPKGARAGIFFHDLMEHLDFTERDEEKIKGLISSKLKAYGFEEIWTDTIFSMTKNVISSPLDPEMVGLRLSEISMKDRINEMEFYFPLKRINPQVLEDALRDCGIMMGHEGMAYDIGRLRFDPVEGFMRGFIDMIFCWNGRFFLVDWKSNLLGEVPDAYSAGSIAEVMRKELYILQLLIYTVALDQYLRVNIPGYRYENDFGKAYYLFLRGIDPEMGTDLGIYRYKPKPELIDYLRETLIAKR
ncbi:MAG: exodeoxyribonuclease V subunit beta [Deltaproteobacteria bacterium]|nr:MAG: exodeoxyribonuclease V subunit beta [Deltaproteobacteria bacterium]